MDSSGSNGPVEPDLDLDEEESFIVGRLVSADVIEHETDHAPDYGEYGVMSGRLALILVCFPCFMSSIMCRVISPHAAYRLSADWLDKDPRTGILGLVYLGLGQERST
jgi:hypothetical protein